MPSTCRALPQRRRCRRRRPAPRRWRCRPPAPRRPARARPRTARRWRRRRLGGHALERGVERRCARLAPRRAAGREEPRRGVRRERDRAGRGPARRRRAPAPPPRATASRGAPSRWRATSAPGAPRDRRRGPAFGARSSAASTAASAASRPCGALPKSTLAAARDALELAAEASPGSGRPRGSRAFVQPRLERQRGRICRHFWTRACRGRRGGAARVEQRGELHGDGAGAARASAARCAQRPPRRRRAQSTPPCARKRRSSEASTALRAAPARSRRAASSASRRRRGSVRSSWSTLAVAVEQRAGRRARCAARTSANDGHGGPAPRQDQPEPRDAARGRGRAHADDGERARPPHGATSTRRFGSSPNISGAYSASTRVGGARSGRPGSGARVYSTVKRALRARTRSRRGRPRSCARSKAGQRRRRPCSPAAAMRRLARRAGAEVGRAGRDRVVDHDPGHVALRLDLEPHAHEVAAAPRPGPAGARVSTGVSVLSMRYPLDSGARSGIAARASSVTHGGPSPPCSHRQLAAAPAGHGKLERAARRAPAPSRAGARRPPRVAVRGARDRRRLERARELLDRERAPRVRDRRVPGAAALAPERAAHEPRQVVAATGRARRGDRTRRSGVGVGGRHQPPETVAASRWRSRAWCPGRSGGRAGSARPRRAARRGRDARASRCSTLHQSSTAEVGQSVGLDGDAVEQRRLGLAVARERLERGELAERRGRRSGIAARAARCAPFDERPRARPRVRVATARRAASSRPRGRSRARRRSAPRCPGRCVGKYLRSPSPSRYDGQRRRRSRASAASSRSADRARHRCSRHVYG